MPDVRALLADPDFRALPQAEQLKGLQELDPDFAKLPQPEQVKALGEPAAAVAPYNIGTGIKRFLNDIVHPEGVTTAKQALTAPLLRPSLILPTEQEAATSNPVTKNVLAFERGATQILEGMTSPLNGLMLLTLGGVGQLAKVASPYARTAARLFDVGLDAYFAKESGKALLDSYPELKKAYQEKNYPKVLTLMGQDAVHGAFATYFGIRGGTKGIELGKTARAAYKYVKSGQPGEPVVIDVKGEIAPPAGTPAGAPRPAPAPPAGGAGPQPAPVAGPALEPVGPTPISRSQQAALWARKADLGLQDAPFRAIVSRITGQDNTKPLTGEQATQVLGELRKLQPPNAKPAGGDSALVDLAKQFIAGRARTNITALEKELKLPRPDARKLFQNLVGQNVIDRLGRPLQPQQEMFPAGQPLQPSQESQPAEPANLQPLPETPVPPDSPTGLSEGPATPELSLMDKARQIGEKYGKITKAGLQTHLGIGPRQADYLLTRLSQSDEIDPNTKKYLKFVAPPKPGKPGAEAKPAVSPPAPPLPSGNVAPAAPVVPAPVAPPVREVPERLLAEPAGAQPAVDLQANPEEVSKSTWSPEPGAIYRNFPVSKIGIDAPRFQYKIGTGAEGVNETLKGLKGYNQEQAGPVHLWHEPEIGIDWLSNGHQRVGLAKRTGTAGIDVHFIAAKDAAEARLKGALINIGENNGTSLDAAKVFRDSGMGPEEVAASNIQMNAPIAKEGLALSNLAQPLFKKVVNGDLPAQRAAVIGAGLKNHADQVALYDSIRQMEKGGSRPTNEEIGEMIRFVPEARKETVQTLFGPEEMTRSLIPQKAQVSAYIRHELAGERRLFGTVGKSAAAAKLGERGNVIKAEENAQVAQEANQGLAIYDKLSASPGPINDILNRAAAEVADGEKPHAAKQRAYEEIRAYLVHESEVLSGKSPRTPERAPGLRGAGNHQVAPRQQSAAPAESQLAPLVTDAAQVQEIKNSIAEGEDILRYKKDASGKPYSKAYLEGVQRSVDKAKAKIYAPAPREEGAPGKKPEVSSPADQPKEKPFDESMLFSLEPSGKIQMEARRARSVLRQTTGGTNLTGNVLFYSDADAVFKRKGIGNEGIIYLNQAAAATIRRAIGAKTSFGGMWADNRELRGIDSALRKLQRDSDLSPRETAGIDRVLKAIQDQRLDVDPRGKQSDALFVVADDVQAGRPISVVVQTARHERFHRVQEQLGRTMKGRFLFRGMEGLSDVSALQQNPAAAAGIDGLTRLGYRTNIGAELGAHLAAGEWAKIGLTFDQAVEAFDHYLGVVAARQSEPSRVATALLKSHSALRRAVREKQNRTGVESEGAGQPATPVQSVAERREGGVGQRAAQIAPGGGGLFDEEVAAPKPRSPEADAVTQPDILSPEQRQELNDALDLRQKEITKLRLEAEFASPLNRNNLRKKLKKAPAPVQTNFFEEAPPDDQGSGMLFSREGEPVYGIDLFREELKSVQGRVAEWRRVRANTLERITADDNPEPARKSLANVDTEIAELSKRQTWLTRQVKSAEAQRGSISLKPSKPAVPDYPARQAQSVFGDAMDLIRPAGSLISRQGGAGEALKYFIDEAADWGDVEAGKRLEKLGDSGLSKLKKADRVGVVDVLEGRTPGTPELQRVAAQVKAVLDETGQVAEDLGVEILAGGRKVPFVKTENYFPHVIRSVRQLASGETRKDVLENLVRLGIKPDLKHAQLFLDEYLGWVDSGGRHDQLVQFLVDSGQAKTRMDATSMLSRLRNSKVLKHGSLEFAREVDLPFWDPDPGRVLPHWIAAVSERLERIRVFGQKNEVVDGMIEQIRESHGDVATVKRAVERILGTIEDLPKGARISAFVRTVQGFKLGLAAIPNTTQGALNSLLYGDLQAVGAGFKGILTKEGRRLGMRSGASIDTVLNEMTRDSGSDWHPLGIYLKAVGFSASERLNRIFAANAGANYAGRLARRLQSNPNNARTRGALEELGIDPDSVHDGQLTGDQILRAAKKFSDITQFRSRPQDLPYWASHPVGKLVFQFKTFGYNQARLLGRTTVGEIRRGNYGNAAKNLLILATVFPMTGAAIGALRDLVTGRGEDKSAWDRYLEGWAKAGALGIINDLLQSAEYSSTRDFLLGPSGSQLADVSQSALRIITQPDKTKALAAFGKTLFRTSGARQIPGAELILRKITPGLFPAKKKKAAQPLTPEMRRLMAAAGGQ